MPETWQVVDNPAWQGRQPAALERSACHDGSHVLTVECDCGHQMHLHESQTRRYPRVSIAAICQGCGELLTFPPGFVSKAFADMRRQGWIV